MTATELCQDVPSLSVRDFVSPIRYSMQPILAASAQFVHGFCHHKRPSREDRCLAPRVEDGYSRTKVSRYKRFLKWKFLLQRIHGKLRSVSVTTAKVCAHAQYPVIDDPPGVYIVQQSITEGSQKKLKKGILPLNILLCLVQLVIRPQLRLQLCEGQFIRRSV